MFHATKALLFKDGIKEHSHVCVPYVNETYPELVGCAKVLNSYRLYREKATYGCDIIVNEEEAKAALEHAKAILEKMKALIG
ncbi:HEPN domain-containing protein [Methanocella conradii]|nr:HEPN domain-containing protein [Methanocella conradii]MDI6896640.1 HEPN domain-containing protein [Methanocella conradii]